MAAGPLLVSEPLQRYRALGMAGDPVWRSAGQLRAAVASRLTPAHAELLAIPEVDPSGRRIDWYAAFDGEVKRLVDLSEGERASILAKVQALHADLARLAEQMEAPDRSGAERNFARLLRNALSAPGEDTLYVVGGKPVMAFWGFTADAALPGVFLASPPVMAMPAAAMVAPMPARPATVLASAPAIAAAAPLAARSTWWQWVLLALLLLGLLALLAWLVRPYLPRLEPRLEAEVRERALAFAVQRPVELQAARVDTLQQESDRLRLELARLTDELARKNDDCRAGVLGPGGVIVGAAPATGTVGTGPDAAVVANLEPKADPNKPIERGAAADMKQPDQTKNEPAQATKPEPNNAEPNKPQPDKPQPDLASKPEANKPEPNKPEPNRPEPKGADANKPDGNKPDGNKQQAQKKEEPKPMVVPPEAKKNEDLAFLKGDWRSRTSLATPQGENDIRPNYTLDDKGKGKVTFVQKNGATCEAPAEARWKDGKLTIEEKANPKCTDGRTYARNTVNCEVGPDGAAQCKGSQPGDNRSYNVQIGR